MIDYALGRNGLDIYAPSEGAQAALRIPTPVLERLLAARRGADRPTRKHTIFCPRPRRICILLASLCLDHGMSASAHFGATRRIVNLYCSESPKIV